MKLRKKFLLNGILKNEMLPFIHYQKIKENDGIIIWQVVQFPLKDLHILTLELNLKT
jgi:hypothetical protein